MATVARSYPFVEKQTKSSEAGSPETLKFDVVLPGRKRRYDLVSVVNETNATTRARIYIAGRGYDHLVAEQNGMVADYLYWFDDPITLTEGTQLQIDLTGTTTSDVLKAYALGVEMLIEG